MLPIMSRACDGFDVLMPIDAAMIVLELLNVPILVKLPVDATLATDMLGLDTRLLADNALPVRFPVNAAADTFEAVMVVTLMLGLPARPVALPVRAPVKVVALMFDAVIDVVAVTFDAVIWPELLKDPTLLTNPVEFILDTVMLGVDTRLLVLFAEPLIFAVSGVLCTAILLNAAV